MPFQALLHLYFFFDASTLDNYQLKSMAAITFPGTAAHLKRFRATMPLLQTAIPLDASGQAAELKAAMAANPVQGSRLQAFARTVMAKPLVAAFARFLGVGVVGLAVDASLFSILDAHRVAPEWSRAASLLLATLVTWRLNRLHTFAPSGRRPAAEALRYGCVTLVAQGFSYGVFLSLVYGLPALPRVISLLAGAGLASVFGFAGHKLFAFRPANRETPANGAP